MDEAPVLRRLQQEQFGILKELVQLCDLHSIRYYLIGGSLLGAVRHQGFIPWDDDIDVGIPRADYERLARLCRSCLPDGYAWQSYDTEPAYPFMFAKLLRTNTVLYEDATKDLDIRHCVSIDVFPLDGTPRTRLGKALHQRAVRFCRLRLAAALPYRGTKRLLARATRLLPVRIAEVTVERLGRRYPYDTSSMVVNAGGAWGYHREAVPRVWFGDGVALPFEGELFRGPVDWDRYLRHIYGDYRQLPEAKHRRSTHARVALELPEHE